MFTIVNGSQLIFNPVNTAAPDFEMPADSDGNNVYNVTISTNDGASTTKAITITVADVPD